MLKTAFFILPDNFFHSMEDNNSQQPEKEVDNSHSLEEDVTF